MSVHSYLRRLRRWAKAAAKPRQVRACLSLETLEDRLVPSTVTVSGTGHNRVLTYQASQNEANDLRISFATTTSGTTYTFEDKGAAIVDANGNLHSSITADDSTFDRIQVNLMDPKNPDTVANTLRILSTGKSISVAGSNGDDTIFLGGGGHGMDGLLDTSSGTITVDGGTGTDKLILDDRDGAAGSTSTGPSHYNFSVNGASVKRDLMNNFGQPLGPETGVSLANMENLEIRAGNDADSFFVASTLATMPVDIKAGDGDNTIFTGNMDLLLGQVTVEGEGGTNSLIINDTSGTEPRNYAINTDSVTQGATTIALDTLSSVEIDGPTNQPSTFDVQTSTSLMPLTLKGGTKSDTVKISDSARSFLDTYNFDAGRLERWTSIVVFALPSASVYYSGIENMEVHAGSGDNSFVMSDTAQPILTIDGGDGTDTLDYSTFAATSPVTVNMTYGNATKVSSLSNVENADGGAGPDLLVGDDNANVLNGNDGNDVIIGGKGTDTILGGAGEDLLFAGNTDYDNAPTKLQTILNTWGGPGTTSSRINKLRNGVGGVKLNNDPTTGTVHDDGDHDEVTAGSSLDPTVVDWIWANKGTKANQDSLTDYLSSTDILN